MFKTIIKEILVGILIVAFCWIGSNIYNSKPQIPTSFIEYDDDHFKYYFFTAENLKGFYKENNIGLFRFYMDFTKSNPDWIKICMLKGNGRVRYENIEGDFYKQIIEFKNVCFHEKIYFIMIVNTNIEIPSNMVRVVANYKENTFTSTIQIDEQKKVTMSKDEEKDLQKFFWKSKEEFRGVKIKQ